MAHGLTLNDSRKAAVSWRGRSAFADAIWFHARHPRRRYRNTNEQVLCAGGSLGLRQVERRSADDRGTGDRHGECAISGTVVNRVPPKERDIAIGVPELRALPAHDGARQHVVRADTHEAVEGGHRAAREKRGRHPRPPPLSRPLSAPAAAAAHRHRHRPRPAVFLFDELPISTPNSASRCAPRSASSRQRLAHASTHHDPVDDDDGRRVVVVRDRPHRRRSGRRSTSMIVR